MMIEQNTNYAYELKNMDNPAFNKVRNVSKNLYCELPQTQQDELYEDLNRGIDVLDSESLMVAYMYAFGQMHQAKLHHTFNKLPEVFVKQKEINIIDYGCGQALGTMCYADFLRQKNYKQHVNNIILIEPSEICLKRAALNVSVFYPDAKIKTINKAFDDLTTDDVVCRKHTPTLHILSNVLDLISFDLERFSNVINKSIQGYNQFVCVGPYFGNSVRDCRIKKFCKLVGGDNLKEEQLDKYEFYHDKPWTCSMGIFNKGVDNCPSNSEKQKLADSYCSQAEKLIWYDGLHTTTSQNDIAQAEQLYKKAADLGDINAMYQLAINNSGRFRKDYDNALFWLNRIKRALEKQNIPLSKNLIDFYIRIFKAQGNMTLVAEYEKLYDSALTQARQKILKDANKSEDDYYELVQSIYEGNNGFEKDKDKAFELIKDGVEKGNRNLYDMYYKLLRERGDANYFHYLMESLNDCKKQSAMDFVKHEKENGIKTAREIQQEYERRCFTRYYKEIAEAYLSGFGVDKNINTAKAYLRQALSCDDYNKDAAIMYAQICNGEYGKEHVDFQEAQRVLKHMYLDSKESQKLNAYLGDAYFGEAITNFFEARKYYNKYPEINKYKSKIRKRFCVTRNIIIALILALAFLIIY